MNQSQLPEVTQRTSLESVQFKDGMVVSADDLHRAMTYPVDVLRTLVRAYLGCGVVCGLEVKPKGASGFAICVTRGLAVDCYGYPLQLADAVTLDLTPDECLTAEAREQGGYSVCIAMRRVVTDEYPRPTGECGETARDPSYQCTRLQEQVQVKAYLEGAEDQPSKASTICMYKPEEAESTQAVDESCETVAEGSENVEEDRDLCSCLKACEDQPCCNDSWVLLACVWVSTKEGVQGIKVDDISYDKRKYVKPIDCLCQERYPMPSHWETAIDEKIKSEIVKIQNKGNTPLAEGEAPESAAAAAK